MNTRKFIDQLAAGENAAAKETLENVLSAKAFETLDDYKKHIASDMFGESVEDNTDYENQLQESDLGNGYKIKMKHSDKGRIHAPSGEHVADVTKHESGWQYHSGNSKWDGTEKSPHYKTGVEKSKMAAARKAAQIHMNEE